ncbi:uncharacterized protein LOC126791164 [Argentina anserina]|uniref:uncharacterized protein LOC126791164 n=1 Tax=Argentina anserina TaxID=57926 RepID=UPI00217642C0|nr:uncharacterized protein LOC126791164 [Potentilla anserina]
MSGIKRLHWMFVGAGGALGHPLPDSPTLDTSEQDGTWGTVKGSCTVVRDIADLCYHSYPLYLKELRESPASEEVRTLRLIHIPACILVASWCFGANGGDSSLHCNCCCEKSIYVV